MNSQSCKPLTELLLPYCDGELSADDCRRVETHLAACPDCRREVALLTRSLEVARAIWQQSAAPSPRHRVPPSPRHRLIPAALAAMAAIALLAVGTWLVLGPQRDSQVTRQTPVTPSPPHPVTPSPAAAAEEIDIEELIAREGRKARLQASIAILAASPSLREYKERAERYLAEAYPETAPGGPSGKPSVQVPRKETKS
jgi:hypothetical protein